MPVHTSEIETELQKIVSMTEIICATEKYTVDWEDILADLAAYVEKYSASCDSARFVADIVHVLKERADHIKRSLLFNTNEAAEYLTLYAICRVSIGSTMCQRSLQLAPIF